MVVAWRGSNSIARENLFDEDPAGLLASKQAVRCGAVQAGRQASSARLPWKVMERPPDSPIPLLEAEAEHSIYFYFIQNQDALISILINWHCSIATRFTISGNEFSLTKN